MLAASKLKFQKTDSFDTAPKAATAALYGTINVTDAAYVVQVGCAGKPDSRICAFIIVLGYGQTHLTGKCSL